MDGTDKVVMNVFLDSEFTLILKWSHEIVMKWNITGEKFTETRMQAVKKAILLVSLKFTAFLSGNKGGKFWRKKNT